MYLAAHEINATHENTLANFQVASNAYLEAGERLTSLLFSTGRQALERHLGHLAQRGQSPAAPLGDSLQQWQNSVHSQSSLLLRESWSIFGQTNHALLQAAKAQIQNVDRVLAATLDRAAKDSPAESAIALTAFRSAIQNMEATLATLAEAAIQSADILEEQVEEVATAVAPAKPAPRRRASQSAETTE